MARKRDHDRPVTPEQCRQFLRDMVLSGPGRRKLAQTVFGDPRMLGTVLKIAVGDDAKTPSYQFISNSTMQMIAALPNEVLEHYVQTGELSAECWRPSRKVEVAPAWTGPSTTVAEEPGNKKDKDRPSIETITKHYPPDPTEH